jgi:uncharacterized membrane protein YedE/YeeE
MPMSILVSHWPSLVGGVLIGLSAALLLLVNGRIAGISGIVAHMLGSPDEGTSWRVAFLVGLVSGPLAFTVITGHAPPVHILARLPVLLVAGLLVGFGTRLGSGCTSGHGVAGLARLSPRSIAAVVTFIAFAMLTVFVARHLITGPIS